MKSNSGVPLGWTPEGCGADTHGPWVAQSLKNQWEVEEQGATSSSGRQAEWQEAAGPVSEQVTAEPGHLLLAQTAVSKLRWL